MFTLVIISVKYTFVSKFRRTPVWTLGISFTQNEKRNVSNEIWLICNFFLSIQDSIFVRAAPQVFHFLAIIKVICIFVYFFNAYILFQNWAKETNFYWQFDFIVFIHNFRSIKSLSIWISFSGEQYLWW